MDTHYTHTHRAGDKGAAVVALLCGGRARVCACGEEREEGRGGPACLLPPGPAEDTDLPDDGTDPFPREPAAVEDKHME